MDKLRIKSAFFSHFERCREIYLNSHRQRRFNELSTNNHQLSTFPPSPIPKLKTKDLEPKTALLGFTLVEVLIVVAILGILAAIVIPLYENNTQKAKESAAKENLRVLRNTIELYAAQHRGVPPGYISDNPDSPPVGALVSLKLVNGRYINAMPYNPFNNLNTVGTINNTSSFPEEATGTYGWIYQPSAKKIKIDYPGKDSSGIKYYDY
jgi:prepilin-type N-terminal cleavage/methylation domain-containing protein